MHANRVDDAASLVPRLTVPAKVQRWWTDLARDYDPVIATTLLASLHLQARGGNVSWRTVMLRDTPIARALHDAGVQPTRERGEWLNLLDRIGLMMTWPDDPRVAMALAGCLRERPFVDRHRMRMRPDAPLSNLLEVIARRILEIGDLRALTRITQLRPQFSDAMREEVANALARTPPPRTTDGSLANAWQAVLDEPFALAPRLVLADAYLERGDPRGDLIALQCAPHVALEEARAAGRAVDAAGLFGRGSERITQLLRAHWYRWFGEVAPVVAEQSKLKAGLLSRVAIGRDRTPAWAWSRAARHRELCAIESLSAMYRVLPEGYAEFLVALPRAPRWVYLSDQLLAPLRGQRVALTGVKYQIGQHHLAQVVDELVAIAPQLAHLKLTYGYPQHMDAVHAVITQFPGIKVEVVNERW